MTLVEYIQQSAGSTRKAILSAPRGRFRAYITEVDRFLLVQHKPDRDVWKNLMKLPEWLINDPNWKLEDE